MSGDMWHGGGGSIHSGASAFALPDVPLLLRVRAASSEAVVLWLIKECSSTEIWDLVSNAALQ